MLDLIHAVVAHGGHGPIPLLAQLPGIKARGRAEGREEAFTVLFGAVALGEAVEDLDQAATKQGIQFKASLMAEQVELHQELIHHAPVEGRDHVRECQMESALAIGNGESNAHSEQPEVERP